MSLLANDLAKLFRIFLHHRRSRLRSIHPPHPRPAAVVASFGACRTQHPATAVCRHRRPAGLRPAAVLSRERSGLTDLATAGTIRRLRLATAILISPHCRQHRPRRFFFNRGVGTAGALAPTDISEGVHHVSDRRPDDEMITVGNQTSPQFHAVSLRRRPERLYSPVESPERFWQV